MSFKYLFVALSIFSLTVACGGGTSAGGEEETTDPTAANAQNNTTEIDNTLTDAPPQPAQELPYSCTALNEETVRSIFQLDAEQALIPVHGQLLGSCYYRFATDEWAADLVLEPINADQTSIFRAQFDEASEQATVKGHDARWANDGRILLIDADNPYIVKLSILPRGEFGRAPDEAERRRLIGEVVDAVDGKL